MAEAYRAPIEASQQHWRSTPLSQSIETQVDQSEKGSDAFRLRYDHLAPVEAIRKDVESYLGEYRLQVQKYDFELGYSDDGSGTHLRSLDDGESMLSKAQRATDHSQRHNPQKVERRLSEYIGIQEEERIVQNSVDGDKYLYFSPPDPNKEDEEGKYGFAFVNQVVKKGQETHVKKTAVRLESQQIDHYRDIISYLTSQDVPFTRPEHFIANPVQLHAHLTDADLDILFNQFFDFKINQENQQRFEMIMQLMESEVLSFVDMIKTQNSSHNIQKTFYALENRALDLKKHSFDRLSQMLKDKNGFNVTNYSKEQDFISFIEQYGFIPPTVGGSCGSTSSESANIFGFNSVYSSLGLEAGIVPINSLMSNEISGNWQEVCVTCPHCDNKEKNLFNGQTYKCGNRHCGSNK